jgi:UMF1 family MFS transporter
VALGAVLFGLGNVAMYTAFVAYDALLPHIARPDEVDRVSLAGYALGYLGGGLLLAGNVAMVLKPAWFGLADGAAASRAAVGTVAVWWLVFTIPVLRGVPEPPVAARGDRGGGVLAGALANLSRTLHELRRFRQAWLLLVAFLIYNDGVGTIFRMATTVGAELGIETPALITAILLVQFVGLPATFLYGALAARVGAKRMVLSGLAVYGAISVLAYFMTTATHFYALAVAVGLVQGGVQALSRSLFARMIPRARSGEFFGLFGVFEKFAGIAGPAVFTLAIQLSGSSRGAIFSIVGFFVVGGLLLARVDVPTGEAAARADD